MTSILSLVVPNEISFTRPAKPSFSAVSSENRGTMRPPVAMAISCRKGKTSMVSAALSTPDHRWAGRDPRPAVLPRTTAQSSPMPCSGNKVLKGRRPAAGTLHTLSQLSPFPSRPHEDHLGCVCGATAHVWAALNVYDPATEVHNQSVSHLSGPTRQQ